MRLIFLELKLRMVAQDGLQGFPQESESEMHITKHGAFEEREECRPVEAEMLTITGGQQGVGWEKDQNVRKAWRWEVGGKKMPLHLQ